MTAITSPSSAPTRAGGGKPRVAYFSCEWNTGAQIALGGSDYWRLALPAAKLFENGWDIIFARNLAESKTHDRIVVQDPTGNWHDDRDIIIIQRWMGKGTAERISRARAAGQVIINEVDDDYWSFPEGHCSKLSTDPTFNTESNREYYRENVIASSLVTVSTPQLADRLADWGPPVKVIRNYIDGAFFPAKPPGDYVGWVGGLPWRGKDLEMLQETVVPWLRERNQFFYHGGAVDRVYMEDRLQYDRVTTKHLVGILDYPKLWDPLRVALIPIDDTPFGRAKSWIKGLEAATRGIPFIHSPHAEYEALGIGLCAYTPEDWVRYLDALEDPVFYQKQVTRGRAKAAELDINKHWYKWAKVLQEAVRT